MVEDLLLYGTTLIVIVIFARSLRRLIKNGDSCKTGGCSDCSSSPSPLCEHNEKKPLKKEKNS